MIKAAFLLPARPNSAPWIAGLWGALALLVLAGPARADSVSTVLDVSAVTCFDCWSVDPDPTLPSISIEAQLTVVPATGTFWDPFLQAFISGSFLEVVAISGLFNGLPMSLIPTPGGDGTSWLYAAPTANSLGYVAFSAGSFDSWLFNDHANDLLATSTGGGFGTVTPVHWTAVPVPEPSSLALLAVGLIGLRFLKSRAA